MTPAELDAIEARGKAVVADVWRHAGVAILIVAEDVPALVAEVRRLQVELAKRDARDEEAWLP